MFRGWHPHVHFGHLVGISAAVTLLAIRHSSCVSSVVRPRLDGKFAGALYHPLPRYSAPGSVLISPPAGRATFLDFAARLRRGDTKRSPACSPPSLWTSDEHLPFAPRCCTPSLRAPASAEHPPRVEHAPSVWSTRASLAQQRGLPAWGTTSVHPVAGRCTIRIRCALCPGREFCQSGSLDVRDVRGRYGSAGETMRRGRVRAYNYAFGRKVGSKRGFRSV